MTVAELIEKLQHYNPDDTVYTMEEADMYEVTTVYTDYRGRVVIEL